MKERFINAYISNAITQPIYKINHILGKILE